MRKTLGLVVATSAVLGVGAIAVAGNGGVMQETLTGYEEFPALSTPGVGEFRAKLDNSEQKIDYEVTFGGFPTDVRQSHIHFENRSNNGPIAVWLCQTTLSPGPAGTPDCPVGGGTVTGTIEPEDVQTAGTSGIAAGEFDEFVRALRSGATYVNVHTIERPGGEIRAQIGGDAAHDPSH